MRKFNRFSGRGGKSTFKCEVCERMTRDTGQGVDHLCYECFEIAGYDNQVNDSGETIDAHQGVLKTCNDYLAKIAKLGGNTQRVIDCNEYIWPDPASLGERETTAPIDQPKKVAVGKLGSHTKNQMADMQKQIDHIARFNKIAGDALREGNNTLYRQAMKDIGRCVREARRVGKFVR
jgi:hypothetical protein